MSGAPSSRQSWELEATDWKQQMEREPQSYSSHADRAPTADETPNPCLPLPSAVLRGSLEHGMLVCLGLLERNPGCFEQAAAAWHARWCEVQPGVGLEESHAALAALEMMSGRERRRGARRLSSLCRTEGLDDVAAVLDAWIEKSSRAAHPRHHVAA